MDYEEMPIPREGDELLTDIFIRVNPPTDVLVSLQRCRVKWESLFLSDLVTAHGRQIERRFLLPPTSNQGRLSTLNFAEERPSYADWERWATFWEQFTLPGLYLHAPLGK